MINRKSHTCFRLVPKSATSDDLEGPLCTVRLPEPTTKIWMKIDPSFQQRRCSPMTLVSGNVRFMQIFAGVPWRRGVKRQCGNQKRRFSGLSDALRLQHLRKWSQHYYIVLFSPLLLFHWLQNTWPWMAWVIILRWFFTITNWELLFTYLL